MWSTLSGHNTSWSALNNPNLKSNQQLNWSNKWNGVRLSSRKMEILRQSISKFDSNTMHEHILVTTSYFDDFSPCKSVGSGYQSLWLLISPVSHLTTESWTWCFKKHALSKSSYTFFGKLLTHWWGTVWSSIPGSLSSWWRELPCCGWRGTYLHASCWWRCRCQPG